MRRLAMNKIREIIRLHEQAHLGQRAIARALNISRPVIKEYINKITKAGLSYETIKSMDDDTLLKCIQNKIQPNSKRYDILSQQFDYFLKELKRTGVTLERLWQEYRTDHPDGYSYSQFCFHFQIWRNTSELTMHINHKAGDKMFVDFAGKKLEIVDRQTGEIQEVETFVAILGASQYTYVEVVNSQQKHDWIKVNQHALYYFGGVPQAIVPDCLKSAVHKTTKYEVDINPEYADFAAHYQTTILPARPGHPKDKALVEGAVRIVYAWIYAEIRNRLFYSLDELNQAIHQELEKYNNRLMQKLNISRKKLFDDIEKEALNPLPVDNYEIRKFKTLKAQFNYHIYLSDDKHYYSVPFRYRGTQLDVIYTDSIVEIFSKNKRIAFHKRNRTTNGYSTIKEHMPSQHRAYGEWTPQRFINWAIKIGENVETVIKTILAKRQHPEQSYKTCLGILSLAKKYDNEALNKACEKAIAFHFFSYKGIKNILQKKLENYQQEIFQSLPSHTNVRGSQYYQ